MQQSMRVTEEHSPLQVPPGMESPVPSQSDAPGKDQDHKASPPCQVRTESNWQEWMLFLSFDVFCCW